MTTLGAFGAALLDADATVPAGLQDGAGAPAGRRYAVYRNNVAVSLREALHSSFPVLVKLLGPENFDGLAGIYLRAHPPGTPLMMHYGQDMPAFLEGFAPLQHIGYLPDVARLELAMRASYHAADAAAFDPAVLGTLAPDALMAARLTLAPSVRIVPSAWPLYDIWRFNMVDGADKPGPVAQSVLITRAAFDPEPHPLTPAETNWLLSVQNDTTMGDALDAATATDPAFDLGALLGRLITQNAITDVKTKD